MRRLISSIALLSAVAVPVAALADAEAETMKFPTRSDILIPHMPVTGVAEFPYSATLQNVNHYAVYDATANKFVPSTVRTEITQPGMSPYAKASILADDSYDTKEELGYVLSDQKQETSVTLYSATDVPPKKVSSGDITVSVGSGKANTTLRIAGGQNSDTYTRAKVYLRYTESITTNSFDIQTNGGNIHTIAVEAKIDGVWRVLDSEHGSYGNNSFISTRASEWVITLGYKNPLRISEVRPTVTYNANATPVALRFLAEKGHSYSLYSGATLVVNTALGETPYLLNRSIIPTPATLAPSVHNEGFQKLDSDGDGVPDVRDNCAYVKNPNQEDENQNQSGDACEDFDHDGISNDIDNCKNIPNSDQRDLDRNRIGDVCEDGDYDGVPDGIDNCPKVSNTNQADVDEDKVGDVCDDTDSRLGAAAPWLPYAGLGVAVLVLALLGAMTMKLPPAPRDEESGL